MTPGYKLREFIESLAATGNASRSCELVGVARRTMYDHRRDDPEFAAAWEQAQELGTDALEDEATRRAYDGVDEPVFFQGKECGTVRKYSDGLLQFLLKARRPERFKDRTASEVSGPGGGAIQVNDARDRIAGRLAGIAAALTTNSDPVGPDAEGS